MNFPLIDYKVSLTYNTKLTPPKQMINNLFSSENLSQYAYNPSLSLYYLAEASFLEQLMGLQNYMEKQMAELKQQTMNMTKMVEDLKREVEERKKGSKKNKIIKAKKVYLKDKSCPHQNCDKRYSSKIALNAHIKKTHQRQPQDSQEYVF